MNIEKKYIYIYRFFFTAFYPSKSIKFHFGWVKKLYLHLFPAYITLVLRTLSQIFDSLLICVNLRSLRLKAVLFKDWVCLLLKKCDTPRLALYGRWGLGRTRFPDLVTFQWNFTFIFYEARQTKKLCIPQKYE